MANVTLQVEGMTCGHCVSSIEGALRKVKGVVNAKVNLKAKNVEIEYNNDQIAVDTLKEVIEDQGYDVV